MKAGSIVLALTLGTLLISATQGEPTTVTERPRALYVGSDRGVIGMLVGADFMVETATTLPAALDGYRVIVVSEYAACHKATAKQLEVYLKQGGGLVLTDGTPSCFPYPTREDSAAAEKAGRGNNDISCIAEWFGARRYTNVWRSNAVTTVADAFGTGLTLGEKVSYAERGGAAIADVAKDAHVVARWKGPAGPVCAFSRRYGDGRLYYQAGSTRPHAAPTLRLLCGGVKWAAAVEQGESERD